MDPMMETTQTEKDVPPVKTRREMEPEKHKKLLVERRRRRQEQRAAARKNGHKLGRKNIRCKRCGSVRVAPEFATTRCSPPKA